MSNHIIARIPERDKYIEKLLIGMLGHPIIQIRDQAVILLNVLYDGIDWHKVDPYTTTIACIGEKFQISYLIESTNFDNVVALCLKSYLFAPYATENVLSFHKPHISNYCEQDGRRFLSVHIDFGRFTRCGFYDWKLCHIKEGGIQSVHKIVDLNCFNESTEKI